MRFNGEHFTSGGKMAEIPEKEDSANLTTKEPRLDSNKCAKCKTEFTADKPSKLLHCLHTFCQECLENFSTSKAREPNKDVSGAEANQLCSEAEVTSTDDSKTRCPECNLEYTEKTVLPNPFIHITKKCETHGEEKSGNENEKFPVCTSCEDNQKATSFCVECQEWLCDPCVVAHKRVKLTKDHTVSSKVKAEEVKDGIFGESKQRHMYCQTHKTEPLKLFCLTCETLTCRDCQLNEHKDHKYQFIEETIEEQKTILLDGVAELKARLQKNQDMAKKITQKEKDIKNQQVEVFKEVRKVADLITNELISWCKQLLNFLQGVCHGRIKDLTYKKKEVETFAKRAQHTIDFVECALQSGDDLSVLHAKSFMARNINSLKDQNINFQNTLLDLNIKYENDAKFLTKNVSKMGFINVNGKSYPQQAPEETPKSNPLNNLNLPQNIMELLNQQPRATREQYNKLPLDKKKLFVQQLMQNRDRQRQIGNQPGNQALSVQQQNPIRVRQYSTDSGAVQDLYKQQQQPVRPPGAQYYPQNPFQSIGYPNRYPSQQPFRPGPGPSAGIQAWRGMSGTVSNAVTSSNPRLPGSNQPLIPACQLPPGRIDIDPLNLRGGNPDPVRVKQEPSEREFGTSCQFSSRSQAQPVPKHPSADSNLRLQSPSTTTTGTIHSPGHTPSPSHSDGGASAVLGSSVPLAMPDINIMDSDRNELMQGLVNPSGQKFSPYHLHPKHDPSDPSEDYCGVCHNGGDLLCCDSCPKVFHLQCHVPVIITNLSSNEVWTCTMCIPDEELIITAPIPREFEVTSTGKRKAPNGLVDKEIKVCERILLELFCLEISTVFHEPVPKSIPNYHKIIKDPMDFGTIKCKLRRGHFAHYNTVEEFLSDVKLVFRNCFKFNSETSDVFAVGKSVQNFFESLVKHFLPCYVEYLRRQTPSPVHMLETNGAEGPSRHKKRRSPAPDSTRDTNSPLSLIKDSLQ